jgi:uncharacterized membrane protein YcjF (UPF0283 family)
LGQEKILYTLFLSIGAAIAYCIVAHRKGKLHVHSLTDTLAVLVSTASIITTTVLLYNTWRKYSLIKQMQIFEESEILYIGIGAVAIIWLSISELVKKFKDLNPTT